MYASDCALVKLGEIGEFERVHGGKECAVKKTAE